MSRWYATALFVTLATMWGLSFPAISVGLEYIPPLLFAAFRYDTAAVLLLGYAAVSTDGWRPVGRNDRQAIVFGGLFLVAGNGLLFIGQQTVPSGVAAILQAMVPIATALWAMGLLGERLTTAGSVGVALGFLGVALVVQPNPDSLLAGDTAGRLIILGQVASVSLGSVLVDRARPSMERVPMTGWAMLVGGLVLHLLSLAAGEPVPASVAEPAAVGAVAYLGVFSTALAFIIYFTILHDRGAFEASLVAYLVPVVATVVGAAVLGETVGILSLVGFVVVFLGFALLKRRALVDMVGAGVS